MKITQETNVAIISVQDVIKEDFGLTQIQFYDPIMFGLYRMGGVELPPTFEPDPIVVFEGHLVNEETKNYQFDMVIEPEEYLKLKDYEKTATKKALEILNLDKSIKEIREEYYYKR